MGTAARADPARGRGRNVQRVGHARRRCPQFFGLDETGGYHFPGFHLEAVQFLQEQRDIKGIATDTLRLDLAECGIFRFTTIGLAITSGA